MKMRLIVLPWLALLAGGCRQDDPMQNIVVPVPRTPFAHDALSIDSGGKEYRFTIEVAKTPQQQAYGLMHRRDMASSHGMLFIMPHVQKVRMWMKDTPMPLDMLFIDKHGVIVTIARATTPYSTDIIGSEDPVRAVLELKGGTADADGIEIGGRVRYRLFK